MKGVLGADVAVEGDTPGAILKTLQQWLSDGTLQWQDGRWEVRPARPRRSPMSSLMEAAIVGGHGFHLDELIEVCPAEPAAALEMLDQSPWFRRDVGWELTDAARLDDVPQEPRRLWHRRWAEVLAARGHWFRMLDHCRAIDEWEFVASHVVEAAHWCVRRYDYAQADDLVNRLAPTPERTALRGQWLVLAGRGAEALPLVHGAWRARALMQLGRLEEALVEWEQAARDAGLPVPAAAAPGLFSGVLVRRMSRTTEPAPAAARHPEVAHICDALVRTHHMLADNRHRHATLYAILTLMQGARETGDAGLLARANVHFGFVYAMWSPPPVSSIERHAAEALKGGLTPMTALDVGYLLTTAGLFERAQEVVVDGVETSREQHDVHHLAWLLLLQAWIQAWTGDFAGSMRSAQEAHDLGLQPLARSVMGLSATLAGERWVWDPVPEGLMPRERQWLLACRMMPGPPLPGGGAFLTLWEDYCRLQKGPAPWHPRLAGSVPPLRCLALACEGELAWHRGALEEARRRFEDAVRLAPQARLFGLRRLLERRLS